MVSAYLEVGGISALTIKSQDSTEPREGTGSYDGAQGTLVSHEETRHAHNQ